MRISLAAVVVVLATSSSMAIASSSEEIESSSPQRRAHRLRRERRTTQEQQEQHRALNEHKKHKPHHGGGGKDHHGKHGARTDDTQQQPTESGGGTDNSILRQGENDVFTSSDLGADPESGMLLISANASDEMCSFCIDGFGPVGPDYVLPTDDGATCGSANSYASTLPTTDDMCAAVKQAEAMCCPGSRQGNSDVSRPIDISMSMPTVPAQGNPLPDDAMPIALPFEASDADASGSDNALPFEAATEATETPPTGDTIPVLVSTRPDTDTALPNEASTGADAQSSLVDDTAAEVILEESPKGDEGMGDGDPVTVDTAATADAVAIAGEATETTTTIPTSTTNPAVGLVSKAAKPIFTEAKAVKQPATAVSSAKSLKESGSISLKMTSAKATKSSKAYSKATKMEKQPGGTKVQKDIIHAVFGKQSSSTDDTMMSYSGKGGSTLVSADETHDDADAPQAKAHKIFKEPAELDAKAQKVSAKSSKMGKQSKKMSSNETRGRGRR